MPTRYWDGSRGWGEVLLGKRQACEAGMLR
jgi:hypothetical protein